MWGLVVFSFVVGLHSVIEAFEVAPDVDRQAWMEVEVWGLGFRVEGWYMSGLSGTLRYKPLYTSLKII